MVYEAQNLTYAEVRATAADRLARHLVGLRIGRECPVGICLERSTEIIVALLTILEASAACLPLDPRYPTQRLRFTGDDSNATLLLTTSERAE